MSEEKNEVEKKDKQDGGDLQPDPETLHTTDPQDNMKGPISSLMNSAKESIDENDKDADADADVKDSEKA